MGLRSNATSLLLIIIILSTTANASDSLASLHEQHIALGKAAEKCGYCMSGRIEAEVFFEDKLAPAMRTASKALEKHPNTETMKLIIEIVLSNKNSASEEFSYSAADALISDPKEFFKLVKKKSVADQIEVLKQADWGVLNHMNLSKEKMQSLRQKLKDNHPKKKAKAEK